jgi:arsenate reductase
MKKRVLILCTGNSCRSQMAEGLWRHYAGDDWDVFSAGLIPVGVNPFAIAAMAEIDIDISHHRSQSVEEFVDEPFDLVVTVCSNAERHCPTFPGSPRREYWPIEDPVAAMGNPEQRLGEFRRARDEIGVKIRDWLEQQL